MRVAGLRTARCATMRHMASKPNVPDLGRLFSKPLEMATAQGLEVVNTALSIAGSQVKYRSSPDPEEKKRVPYAVRNETKSRKEESRFWNPYAEDSPFTLGREAFLAKWLSKGRESVELVPDEDVENYVDAMLEAEVLRNLTLPFGSGRVVYIRIVRILLRTILSACQAVDGTEAIGKTLVFLKTPSSKRLARRRGSPLDLEFIKLLADRAVKDHQLTSPYLLEFGIPLPLVRRLYEDIIALSVQLTLDVCFTFEIRCLGHTLKCEILADEHLHTAPGWEVGLESGVFGRFEDKAKRTMARSFVADLLLDEAVVVPGMPRALQEEVYTRAVLVLLNLTETALNHFRIHVAGMSFRPALLSNTCK